MFRRVGPHTCGPPAAGGGRLAVPRGGQGRKRPALGKPFGPGKPRTPSALTSAAADCPLRVKEAQRLFDFLPRFSAAPDTRDGAKANTRPGASRQKAGSLCRHRLGRPPSARRATAPERGKAFFSLDRAIAQPLAALPPYGCGIPLAGTARFLFHKTEKKMGVEWTGYHHSRIPRAADCRPCVPAGRPFLSSAGR